MSYLCAPAIAVAAGECAAYRFPKFFTAQIRNPHTGRTYTRSVGDSCVWPDGYGRPAITAVGSIHIATYVEEFGLSHSALTVKERLAAIRMMFN